MKFLSELNQPVAQLLLHLSQPSLFSLHQGLFSFLKICLVFILYLLLVDIFDGVVCIFIFDIVVVADAVVCIFPFVIVVSAVCGCTC